MRQGGLKDPLLVGLLALGLVSVPLTWLLAHQYKSYEERIVQASRQMAGPQFTQIPTEEQWLKLLHEVEPNTVGVIPRKLYVPDSEPRSGLAGVYELLQEDQPLYQFALFRHDIACSVCRDILAGALYNARDETVAQVLLIDPWEVRGAPVDTRAFLAQFRGKRSWDALEIGNNVDGISGATKSTRGLVKRLNEAALWLQEHKNIKDFSGSK